MRMTEIEPGLKCSMGAPHVHDDGTWNVDLHVQCPSRLQMLRFITYNFVVPWYSFPGLFWRVVIKGMHT